MLQAASACVCQVTSSIHSNKAKTNVVKLAPLLHRTRRHWTDCTANNGQLLHSNTLSTHSTSHAADVQLVTGHHCVTDRQTDSVGDKFILRLSCTQSHSPASQQEAVVQDQQIWLPIVNGHTARTNTFIFSMRCNIYISRLCHDASPSVCDGSALAHYS